MLYDEQYMERTPDLVARVRKMREGADKEMNRFTCVADYDVRRVVGLKPKASTVPASTVPGATTPPAPVVERPKRSSTKSVSAQTSIEFAPAPAERGDDGEDA